MYNSPIEMLITDIQNQIVKQQDEEIYKAVVSFIPNIDKDELIRALNYDRNQYEKGHLDGVAEATPKWIPVTERLPEKYGKYLCRYVFNESAEYPHLEVISYYPTMTRFQGEGSCGMRVTHWMPLPEPPKGE